MATTLLSSRPNSHRRWPSTHAARSPLPWRSPRRSLFDDLAWLTGRHRIQRVPPNDKKGRRQSSEVTVVSISALTDSTVSKLDPADVKIETMRGTGPGGQHRNVTDSKVVATHLPTGIQAASDDRSQHDNRRKALAVLSDRVAEHYRSREAASVNNSRQEQASGERSFTWTEWRDSVTNHRTGRKAKMSRALKGQLDQLR